MSSTLLIAVAAGGTLGLASVAHCAVMCGPLAMASRARCGVQAGVSYFTGRLVSYTVLGALAGGVGRALFASPWARWLEALLSWLLAAMLAWSAAQALRERPVEAPLLTLGKAPRISVGRALARVADDPLLLGAATALLPCGALFAALAGAAALGTASSGALALASFATVTGLAVLGVAQLGALRSRGPGLRGTLAALLLVGSAILIYRPVQLLRAPAGEVPACHAASAASAAQEARP